MLLLPPPAYPAYNVLTAIDGVDYELVYTYDEHRDLWRFGINNESGDAVMGHRPLLPFVQMRPNAFASALDGVFALIAPLPTDDAYEALVGGLWSVVYGLPAEIAELAESLADLAGDADTPVVPIEVIYPPNNAVLSNPVVTFSGTGPANQLLFARGESIQIDSMGSWVWTHTFNESNPVVVFEGESGQRATVRLSIIMQPLLINPVGEDIDGTRYAFTEYVEVTGAATPDSAITVNGQPVSVGGDGLWSIVLTLSAGQSHTVTAQAGDGQVAQTSVYVWGEPDLLALQPAVWLDPSDVATLFVDSAGTTPVQFSGDPVGLWKNKGTAGAAGDAVQPVSTRRGIWRGTHIEGNVKDDAVEMTYPLASPYTVFVSAPGDWTGSPTGVWGSLSRGSAENVYLRISRSSDQVRARRSGGAVGFSVSRGGSDTHVITVDDLVRGYNGGNEGVSEAGTSFSDFIQALPVRYGRLENVPDGSSTIFGGYLAFSRVLTTEERLKVTAWMEAQHGI